MRREALLAAGFLAHGHAAAIGGDRGERCRWVRVVSEKEKGRGRAVQMMGRKLGLAAWWVRLVQLAG